MERSESLSSLTYNGSIPEAILEAKNQKKLFVVYISGEDDESKNLEDSMWNDPKVKESLSKYCILLHIRGGSIDAENFSAIYPQKSVPCITAIGYNGVQVWQSGFVSAEVLASSLEKAWLSLHIQETTAAVLSAALASKKYESSSSGASTFGPYEQGSSSNTSVPSTTMDEAVRSLESKPAVTSGVIEEKNDNENTVKEKNSELVDKSSSESFSADNLDNVVDEQCDVPNEAPLTVVSPVTSRPVDPVSENTSSCTEDCPFPVKGNDHHSSFPSGSSPVSAAEAEKAMQHEKDKGIDDQQDVASENSANANIPTDVHLNIRLPDGSSLQEKFPVAYTLRMIKDYVDRNQSSGMGSYNLAIPYPRKVFGDQDLSKSLMDLGLLNRQALIVVPHQRTSGFQGQRSSADQRNSAPTEASTGNNGGYFAYIKSFLSYVNPLSYLGGDTSSSATEQESRSGVWEYGQVIGIHSSRELETKLNSTTRTSRLVILYFTATWCGPCRLISPLYTSLAAKYANVVFLKVDIDEARDVAARWNVSSVPTFFFIRNGKEVDKVVGADNSTLERKIAQYAG
ncbi:hypothetical protein REPUB_Repub20aG0044400 [Reevesia pubescens]